MPHHEIRYLPRRTTRISAVRLYVEELILGPADVGAVPFIPPNTRVLSIFLTRDGRLIVNVTNDVMFSPGGATAIEDIKSLIEWNLLFNFRFIREVVLTIDGQVPGFPAIISN